MKAIIQRIRTAAILAVLFAIGLASTARAAAPVPTVVWESDFVDNGTKIGTDGNTYTFKIDNTGNSIDNGVLVISSTATRGATIELGDTEKTKISVLVKYSNLSAPGGTSTTNCFASIRLGNGNNFPLLRNENASSLKAGLSYAGNVAAAKAFNDSGASFPNGSGYALFSYSSGSGTMAYVGSYIASLSGKENTTIKWGSSKITRIALGGPCADNNNPNATAWPNLKIEKVAIFLDTYYSAADVSDFKWPSEVKVELAQWLGNDDKTVYAWRCPTATSTFHTSQFVQIDADGNSSTNMTMKNDSVFPYTRFTGAGSILVYNVSGYRADSDAQFTPFYVDGMYVNAVGNNDTPYSIWGYDNRADGNRKTTLGTSEFESYFTFNESFVFARTNGVSQISGTLNLSVAAGKEFDLNSQVDEKSAAELASGAVLKMSGEGNLKVNSIDATSGTLDFTALSERSAALPFINGTVKLGANTGIVLPAGTTSPYKIGTAVTGEYPTSITIGSKTYPIAVSAGENAGEIAWTICEADIDAAGTYGLEGSGEDDLFASISSTGAYIINVNESATLNVASAISLGAITFNVASGKTLTLTGEAITATGGIVVNGSTGIISMTSSALVGAFSGDGVVKYTKVQPRTNASSSVDFTNSAWTGTVWLYDWNYSITQDQALYVSCWCNSGSKLKFTKVKGYLPTSGQLGYDGSTLGELVLEDEGSAAAFNRTDGYSHSSANNYYCAFTKLSGSGTFTDSKSQYIYVVFGDISTFTGTFKLTNSTTIIVDESSPAGTTYDGKLYVAAGKTASVSDGKTWNFVNGVFVNGTVELNAGATIPKVAAASTGSVTVTSGIGSVSGVDNSVFPAIITIYPNATLAISDTSVTSLTIPAEFTDFTNFTYYNGGTLDLSGCTSLTTLRLDLGSSTSFSLSNVTLPATCTTIKYVTNLGTGRAVPYTSPIGLDTRTWQVELSATETKAEYANGSFELTGLPSDTTVVVTRADGTTASATVSDGTAHLSDYGAVKISGAATDIDWDFTDGEDDALEQAPSGVSTNADSTMTFYTDATDSTKTGVYIKHHPYITGAASFMGNNSAAMTVAVVGTMPATTNTIFLNVGSAYSQQYGLVFVTTTNANEVLIGYNYGGTVTPITTMTVPNSSTARHSYIVTKVDGDTTTTFTVYLDGIKWKTVTTASKIVFASSDSGVQVGSDFGNQIRNAGTYIGADDDVGVLNVLRVYGRIITEAEIAVYASTFPYVSPNGASSRTFATATEDWVETTDTDWTNTDSSGTVTSGTAPTAGASVTVTATAETEITVNLDSDTQYEALTINGSATTLAANSGSGKISVTGMTVIGAPVTVEYGAADFTGGPMTITEDGSITFDYSAYDISAIYTTTDIPLTSDVDEDAGKVFLTAPSASYRTVSLVYTSGHYAMRVTPNHQNGAEVYFNSGYLASNMNGTGCGTVYVDSAFTTQTVMFPGDTMVINDNSTLSSDKVWIKDDFVGNIRISRTSAMSLLNGGDASGAILDGVTITVDSGSTLNISKNDTAALNIGAAIVNGEGTVNMPSATTVSGAISGSATLTVSGTVNVASGGSIANAVAGTGTITYATFPASAPAFNNSWSGEVHLPGNASIAGTNFGNWGKSGSKIVLDGDMAGWIAQNTSVSAEMVLDGHSFTVNDFSSSSYSFFKISGSGALSFNYKENGYQPSSLTIGEIAPTYSGVITNNTTATLNITTIALAEGSSVAGGAKLLAIGGSGSFSVGSVTVGGVAQSVTLVKKSDGIYVAEEVAVTVEVPTGTEVAVTATHSGVSGSAIISSSGNVYTVVKGATVDVTWTAVSGYTVSGTTSASATASDTMTINAPAGLVVQQNTSITGVSVSYYASYTNADVTATVSAPGTYTLTVGVTDYSGVVDGTTVTFSNVDVSGVGLGEGVSYTITASGAATGSTSGTSSETKGTAVASDAWMKWTVSEHAENSSWTTNGVANITEIPYSNGEAAFTGTNIYTAAWVSTGEVVTVNTSVKFGGAADEDLTIDTDAQAAVRIGSAGNFQVYEGSTPWTDVFYDGLTPSGETEYAVTIKLDYTKQKYGVSVANYGALTNATGGAEFALARNASQMQKVSYIGAGSFVSLSGSYISAGYTADVGTEGSATNVVVSSEFVNNYMSDKLASQVSAALSPKAERNCNNGLNYFESYALGLAPTDAEDKPLVDVTTDADGKFVVTLKDKNGNVLTPAANVALKLTMKSGSTPDSLNTETEATSGAGSAAQFTINPADMGEATVKYYKVKVDIGAK